MVTLLLIEDDHNTARMVAKVLTPHGFTVHHAPNGLTGLQLAREVNPQLILVDMDLPDLEGKVVVSRLRGSAESAQLPIVAFTAECSARAKRLALAFGCDAFISKPIDTRAFPEQLREIMTRKKEGLSHVSKADSLR
ncbi:MAG: two-component system response regulator [Candidatus Thermofonsia Clade 1 bacterium]|jgi:DNA-binding response OmpR family regulator|uniref:Two-component system response regulator n=1 Tax=Candidatus Thermofonsia Clade 1 bacterium TaxID=2364210 RepID=A0A2M8PHR7_9CHLR|nr:MAG: two-component system response regulator [Candidatus Thermofonsia Clade 1 bacterium]RMF49661.1 MAG: response regulator [Chloroflexota bacterium]